MISISLHLAMYCQAAWEQTMLLRLLVLLLRLVAAAAAAAGYLDVDVATLVATGRSLDILPAFGYVCCLDLDVLFCLLAALHICINCLLLLQLQLLPLPPLLLLLHVFVFWHCTRVWLTNGLIVLLPHRFAFEFGQKSNALWVSFFFSLPPDIFRIYFIWFWFFFGLLTRMRTHFRTETPRLGTPLATCRSVSLAAYLAKSHSFSILFLPAF